LARDGHRDARLLWRSDSASPQIIWMWIAPWVLKARADSHFGVPTDEDLEWLAATMAEMDAKGGRPAITEAQVQRNRDHLIACTRTSSATPLRRGQPDGGQASFAASAEPLVAATSVGRVGLRREGRPDVRPS
jgi:hypothetical protein